MVYSRPSPAANDEITIEGLEVEGIIGLYERERTEPQLLVVAATLTVDATQAALEERLDGTVDYEWVATQIAFILKTGRFRLLETAAYTICSALLLAPMDGEFRNPIQAVDLRLRKPGALGGRGVPELRLRRRAGELRFKQESKPFGSVDVIHETREAGFYRLNVFPGRAIALHEHRTMQEEELVLSEGLRCQGERAPRGSVREWTHGHPHHYENPTQLTQTILCVDRPPFIEDDEVFVAGTAVPVSAKNVWDI